MILKEHLYKYLKDHSGWHRKGSLYEVSDTMGYSPEGCGRMLRELAEEGLIQVEYYEGQRKQKLARYSYEAPVEPKKIIKLIDGRAIETYV